MKSCVLNLKPKKTTVIKDHLIAWLHDRKFPQFFHTKSIWFSNVAGMLVIAAVVSTCV